jgi:hypothetical protein
MNGSGILAMLRANYSSVYVVAWQLWDHFKGWLDITSYWPDKALQIHT